MPSDPPQLLDTDQSNQPRSIVGLELIDNDDTSDMPLPMGMAEEISNAAEPPKQIGKVEQLEDDDCPTPPVAMLETSLNAAEKSNKMIRSSLESIDDEFNTRRLLHSILQSLNKMQLQKIIVKKRYPPRKEIQYTFHQIAKDHHQIH